MTNQPKRAWRRFPSSRFLSSQSPSRPLSAPSQKQLFSEHPINRFALSLIQRLAPVPTDRDFRTGLESFGPNSTVTQTARRATRPHNHSDTTAFWTGTGWRSPPIRRRCHSVLDARTKASPLQFFFSKHDESWIADSSFRRFRNDLFEYID